MKQIISFFLLCSTALADGPSIVGSPSLRVKVGTPPWVLLTVKDAPESAVQTWAGDIGGTGVAIETKQGLGVSTAVAGAHSFRCVVQTPSEGLDPIQVLDVTVVVEGKDGVIPQPPPPPVVEDFATKLSKAVAGKPDAHEGFARVAKLYETVADQIKGGLLKTPEAVTQFTDSLTPVASPAWLEIKTAIVDPHLATLTLKTAADYEPVWRRIAAAIKAGLTDIPPPVPDVDPPIPTAEFRVLILEETADRSKLPLSQLSVITSAPLRTWLKENGVKWRVWDQNIDAANEDAAWQAALKLPHGPLPWIHVSNGTTGFSGPLPLTVEETKTLIGKYKP